MQKLSENWTLKPWNKVGDFSCVKEGCMGPKLNWVSTWIMNPSAYGNCAAHLAPNVMTKLCVRKRLVMRVSAIAAGHKGLSEFAVVDLSCLGQSVSHSWRHWVSHWVAYSLHSHGSTAYFAPGVHSAALPHTKQASSVTQLTQTDSNSLLLHMEVREFYFCHRFYYYTSIESLCTYGHLEQRTKDIGRVYFLLCHWFFS